MNKVPVGYITLADTKNGMPEGWMACDGRILCALDGYYDLRDVLGNDYGGVSFYFRIPKINHDTLTFIIKYKSC